MIVAMTLALGLFTPSGCSSDPGAGLRPARGPGRLRREAASLVPLVTSKLARNFLKASPTCRRSPRAPSS